MRSLLLSTTSEAAYSEMQRVESGSGNSLRAWNVSCASTNATVTVQ